MKKVERPPYIGKKWELEKLVQELPPDKLSQLIEINDASYPYWDKWKYLAKDWGFDPKKLWSIVLAHRQPKKQITFSGIEGFGMYVSTPSIVQQLLHELDLDLGGSLHSKSLIPADAKQQYLVSSLMEEAIASSQLEGAATTRKIAKEMLESNRKPRNVSEQMIANNYEVMQWIVRNKDKRLTPGLILQIHHIITNDTLSVKEEEGIFRKSDDIHIIDVQTGNIIHTPPAHELLEKIMDEFCLFANDNKKENFFLHPISKAIIIHFLIGYIHPFTDGNGRTARALFYWYLIKKGYWLIEYMSVSRIILASKARYARAYQYTENDGNDLTYFILYNLNAINRALEELRRYIEKKRQDRNFVLGILRDTNYNHRQIDLITQILKGDKKAFTVSELETRFDVSNQTARNDLNYFVEKGVLVPRKDGKKIQFIITTDAQKRLKDFMGHT